MNPMKIRSRCLLGVVLLVLISMGANPVLASTGTESEPLSLDITYATYLDLDEDGIQDDIVTEFSIYSPLFLSM